MIATVDSGGTNFHATTGDGWSYIAQQGTQVSFVANGIQFPSHSRQVNITN